MSILNDRGISFVNKVVAGKIVKATNGSDPDMGLISSYKSLATMERILDVWIKQLLDSLI